MFYHFISCCQLIGLNIHPHIIIYISVIIVAYYIYYDNLIKILFGIAAADLTGSLFGKKFSTHLVPLIKVEGLFAQYIVINFDIVHLSGTLV